MVQKLTNIDLWQCWLVIFWQNSIILRYHILWNFGTKNIKSDIFLLQSLTKSMSHTYSKWLCLGLSSPPTLLIKVIIFSIFAKTAILCCQLLTETKTHVKLQGIWGWEEASEMTWVIRLATPQTNWLVLG